MALVQRQLSEKKQFVLYGALGGVLLITFLVAYFGMIRKPVVVNTTPPPPIEASQAAAAKTKVPVRSGLDNLKAFEDSAAFQKLKQFGRWPFSVEPKGRADPFLVVPQETKPKE